MSIDAENSGHAKTPGWLNQAIFYQIFPPSFYDSNGDGIGDIPGIIRKLDYLQWLGINAIWLNPCFVSHFQDAGYDVADYYRIAPRYGTNRDLYRLCREAHRHGIKICLDLVAGHTSLEHPWFRASCYARRNRYSDRFIWTNSAISIPDTPLPLIRGYAERDGAYLANCFYFQPALNYGFARPAQPWQQPVDAPAPLANRRELLKIMDFWLSHGVDGFRVDMAFSLVKLDPGHRETIRLWQEIGPQIRSRYPEMVLISEWGNPVEAIEAGFNTDFLLHFGVSGYPDLLLNQDCFFRRTGGKGIGAFLKAYLEIAGKINGKGLISIPSSNHDMKRPRADGRTLDDLKVIFTFLLTWAGVPFIYYGDEIGMRYISGLKSKEGGYGRTGSRTPMQWDNTPGAGFSIASEKQLYLPLDPHRRRPNVAEQIDDPASLLNHIRQLIALRKQSQALQAEGELIPLPVKESDHHFAYLRQSGEKRFLIAVNPAASSASLKVPGIKPASLSPQICRRVKAQIEEDGLRIEMGGVSYAVFSL
jgi:maltose alpha-D-glucosyltransferase/alpha-amylase